MAIGFMAVLVVGIAVLAGSLTSAGRTGTAVPVPVRASRRLPPRRA